MKGGLKMKELLERMLVMSAEKVVKSNVNEACWWHLHQPKLPKAAEKFKKV